jgi:septum formation protein
VARVKPILLASQSRYKIALFEKLGLPFTAASPPFEEVLTTALAPAKLAQNLAHGKATALAASYPDHVIIGADQVLALDDDVMGKPGSVEAAVEQLTRLSGRTHRLHTAVSVLDPASGQRLEAVETATIRFWPNLSRDFLKAAASC